MSSITDPLTIRLNFLMSRLNLSFPRPIDQKLFQTMTKLTEGISARDVFREAETLCAQGADPNTVGTDVDTGKSVHMLAGLLYGSSDWLNCSMVRLAEFLVSHGFDPRVDNGRNGAQSLAYACYLNALNDGLMNGLKYLLKVGADPTCPFGVIGNEGADCFADPYSNGISHGGQKTPLNTAYLSILQSKYEAFELWQPSRIWAVYRLLMSALRKDNNIDNVQLPVHCLGQSVVQLYALSNCHLVPSRCGECGVEFEVSRNQDGLDPCFVLQCGKTALVINQCLFSYCDASFLGQIQGTRIDLPIEATGPRIVDLIGQYKDRDKRDQLTVVLDNRLALVWDNLCKERRLAFSIKTMPVKYRPGRKNKGSIFV